MYTYISIFIYLFMNIYQCKIIFLQLASNYCIKIASHIAYWLAILNY